MIHHKLILTDVDGCLLWWEQGFHDWMKYRGHDRQSPDDAYWMWDHYPHLSQKQAKRHVEEYNGSSWMLGLEAFRDARQGVARLVDNGYKFHAITSMGTDPYAKELRMMNLERVFGTQAFVDLTVTEMYETKNKALWRYRNSGLPWIEDKDENALLGVKLGLNTYLLDHKHNAHLDDPAVKRVNNWNDICNDLIGVN